MLKSSEGKQRIIAYQAVNDFNSRNRDIQKSANIAIFKRNKTPAQAFTPPAEKKIGAKWAFMYNCLGKEHEKWLFKNI